MYEPPKKFNIDLLKVANDFMELIESPYRVKKEPINEIIMIGLPFNRMKIDVGLSFSIKLVGLGKITLKLEYHLSRMGSQFTSQLTERTFLELCSNTNKMTMNLQKRGMDFLVHCNEKKDFIFKLAPKEWLIDN